MTKGTLDQSRPIGCMESYNVARTEQNVYTNFRVVGTYENLNVAKLTIGLRNLILKHSVFSLTAYGETGDRENPPRVKQLVKITKDQVIKIKDIPRLKDTKVDSQLFLDINKITFKYNCEEPLFQVWVINNETVAFFANHLYFDGGSGREFHKHLLQEMNSIDDPKPIEILFDGNIDPTPSLFYSPTEEIVVPSWKTLFKAFVKHSLPLPTYYRQLILDYINGDTTLSGKRFISKTKYKIGYHDMKCEIIKISPEKLTILKKTMKESGRKTSITALIIYLVYQSFASINKERLDLIISYPIDGRPFLNLKDLPFGMCVCSGRFLLPFAEFKKDIDWDSIEQIKNKIDAQSRSKEPHEAVGLVKYVDLKNAFKEMENKPIETTFELSNLGMCQTLNDEDVNDDQTKLVDLYFSQCIGAAGGLLNGNSASTKIGGMNLVLEYYPAEEPEILEVIQNFKSILNSIN